MNVLQNMMEFYNMLPLDSTYRTVIKGILEHLDQMENVTVYDVAEMTNSSRTTVWRAVQKMGYNNFTDFRLALQNAIADYTYYNRMIQKKYCSDPKELSSQLKRQLLESWAATDQFLTPELMEELTDALHDADQIHFYLPFQLPTVYSLQQNLSMTGKNTAYCTLLPEMLSDAETLSENSIVIISTIEHAETLNLQSVFSSIKKKGAMLWLVGDSTSRYVHYVDRILIDGQLNPVGAIMAFQILFLMLSEYYRTRFIDE